MIKIKKIIQNRIFIDIIIIFLTIIFFFKPVFFDHKIISPADFLFNWAPWANIAPNNYTGPSNYVMSDHIDVGVPGYSYMLQNTHNIKQYINNYYNGTNGGRPDPNILGFSIYNFILLVFIKFINIPFGLTYYFILKTFIGGIGMYFLLKEYGVKSQISIFGAVSFMFSSSYLGALVEDLSLIYCLLPLSYVFIEKIYKKPSIIYSLAFIITLFLNFSAAFPMLTVYSYIFILLYFFFKLISEKEPFKLKLLKLINFSIINIIFLLIVSIAVLPNLSIYQSSDFNYRNNYGIRYLNSIHLLRMLYPNICGNHINIPWVCLSNWHETTGFTGILPIIFIFFAFLNPIKTLLNKTKWFFILLTTLQVCLIFNLFNILSFISKIPIFSSNPSSRLIILLPFTLVISGCISFQEFIFSKYKKRNIIFFCSVLIISILKVKFSSQEILIKSLDYIKLIPTNFLLSDLYIILLVIITTLTTLILFLKTKNNFIKNISLFLIIFVVIIESFHYNKLYNPYIEATKYFPLTPGINYIKQNIERYERVMTIENVFLATTPNYYNINTLVGHEYTTKEFKENMQYIDSNIFKTSSIYGRFNRTTAILDTKIQNFLKFYRVKFLLLNPNALSPKHQIINQQTDYNTTIDVSTNLEYNIVFSKKNNINGLLINTINTNNNDCNIISKITVIRDNKKIVNLPVLKQQCQEGSVYISYKQFEINDKDILKLNFYENNNIKILTYSITDIFLSGYSTNNAKEDISFYIFNETTEEPFFLSYKGNDMDIYEINNQESTAYFYPCKNNEKESCKSDFSKLTLQDFDNLYNRSSPIKIIKYQNGSIIFDIHNIKENGIVFFSDNYFKGWKSKNINTEVFKGYQGNISIYINKNTTNNLEIYYINPYIKISLLLTSFGILSFVLYSFIINKINLKK